MPISFSSAGPPPLDSWAEVRANDRVMRYRKLGTGRAVVVLLGGGEDRADGLWAVLANALGSDFRLIFPDGPDDVAHIACWLGDFLEGLGLSRVGVVAAGRHAIPALQLAASDGELVARVAVVVDPGPAVQMASRHR